MLKWVSILFFFLSPSLSWSWMSWCLSQCAKHDPHSWVNTGERRGGRPPPPHACQISALFNNASCALDSFMRKYKHEDTNRHKTSVQSTHERHGVTYAFCLFKTLKNNVRVYCLSGSAGSRSLFFFFFFPGSSVNASRPRASQVCNRAT